MKEPMNDLLDTMLRYERGELSTSEREEVRLRLERDAEARAWLEWIAGLRRASASDGFAVAGSSAPDEIEIAALAEGTLAEERADEVRAALASCADGYAMLEAALDEVRALAAERVAGPASPPRRGPRRLPGSFGWLALAASLLALLALWGRGDDSNADVVALARLEALPVATLRSGSDSLEQGLGAYRDADYPTAVTHLRAATESDPESSEAWLYLGSAQLLLKRTAEARSALERAVVADGSWSAEARWQLAQLALAAGDAEDARARLETCLDAHRAEEARALLERLDAR